MYTYIYTHIHIYIYIHIQIYIYIHIQIYSVVCHNLPLMKPLKDLPTAIISDPRGPIKRPHGAETGKARPGHKAMGPWAMAFSVRRKGQKTEISWTKYVQVPEENMGNFI